MRSLAALVFALPLLAGDPPRWNPDEVARLGEEAVTLAEYKDFLYLLLAQSRLPDLLEAKLLRREAARLGVAPAAPELARARQREQETLLKERFQGRMDLMVENLLGRGYTVPEMEEWLGFDVERRLLQDRIVRATREATPEQIRRKFEDQYGLDGRRVEVRHIQLSLAPLLQAELAGGRRLEEIDRAGLERQVEKRAEELWARIQGGEDFVKICLEASDEPGVRGLAGNPVAARQAGLVPGYNYQRFGGAFADAVRALPVGGVSRPVAFRAEGNLISCHLVRVESRTETRLEDVREAVIQALREEEPTYFERLKLRQRLLEAPDVRTRSPRPAAEERR